MKEPEIEGHNKEQMTNPSKIVPERFPGLTVREEDVLAAARQAKRLTSGGLQQITPWHLKRAFHETSNTDCAIAAARLATR